MSILPQEVPQPVLADWAAGHDGHGHPVRDDIKLAAQLRLAATDDGTNDKPFPGGEDGWNESDWDDVRAYLESESPWFKKILAGESPGDPDDDPSVALPTQAQVAASMQGALVKFTPHTAEASTVHKPTVPPGGPGLFHMKGHQLPPYVQHLYRHLVGKYGKHRAYGVAIGIVKKWASGINPGGKGKGHKVHADVQAAAAKNVGEWEKEKAEAHAQHGKSDHAKATSSLDKVVALAHPYVRFERGREEHVRGYIGRNLRGDRQVDEIARPAAAALHERVSAETRAKALELYHRLPPGMQVELAHFAHAPLTVKVRAALGAAKNLHDMQDALPKWYRYVFKYGTLLTLVSPLPGDEALPYVVVAAGVLARHRRLLHVAWHGAQLEVGDYEVARMASEAQAYADHLLMRGPEDMAPLHETDNSFTALSTVKEYARRSASGKVETVRSYQRTGERGTVAFDFDGVLHERRGYSWPPGQLDFDGIRLAHERGYNAAIVTANEPELIARELRKQGLKPVLDPGMHTLFWNGGPDGHQVLVTGRKVAASAYVDDRAVNHMWGDDWGRTLDNIQRVKDGLHPLEQEGSHKHFAGAELSAQGHAAVRVYLAAPAANPSGMPYRRSFLPPVGPSDLKQGSITNPGVVSAPGAKPQRMPFGNPVMQHAPSQTVAAGPPLPPAVSLPTSKEITDLIKQVPDEPDVTLASGIKKHLTAAARKTSLGDNIGALAAMRSVQTGVHAGYRAAVMANVPNEAAVFSAAGFAGKVDNPDAVKARDSGRQLILDYRQLHHDVAGHIDRFRRTYFHGQYNNTAELRMSVLHPGRPSMDAVFMGLDFNGHHSPAVYGATDAQLQKIADGKYGGYAPDSDSATARIARSVLAKRAAAAQKGKSAAQQKEYAAHYFTPEEESVRGGRGQARVEHVKAHERREPSGKVQYVRETYRHVDPAKVGVDKRSGMWAGRMNPLMVVAQDRDRESAPAYGGTLEFGRLEHHGAFWHGIHEDGTDTGPKASKQIAVNALVDYHNQQAAAHPYDPEKTARLEEEADRLDPLKQMEREQAAAKAEQAEAERRAEELHNMSDADLRREWRDAGDMVSDIVDSDGSEDEIAHYEDEEKRFAQEIDRRQKAKAAQPEQAALFTGTDEGTLQLTRNVKSYKRIEGGHLETVRAYSAAGRNRQMDMHLKYLNRLLGGGKKYTPGQGFFIDSKGEKHWGWHGAAGLLVQHTDEQGVTRFLLQRRAGSVQHGGTWSTPGGAIDNNMSTGKVETPEEAAFREGGEEFGPEFQNRVMHMKVVGRDTQGFGTPGTVGYWAYHTIRVSSPDKFDPTKGKKGKDSWEAGGFKWVTPKEMATLPLHPGFRDTALKLGMPDVPNPKPYSDSYGYGSYGGSGSTLGNDQESDYKKGMRVTWRRGGKTLHGEVQGPGKNLTTNNVKDGASLPEGYVVKSDDKDGWTGEVKWGQLRLETPRKPAGTFPGGTSKSYETKQPQAPAKPQGASTPGPVPAITPTATVAKSKLTPGMQMQVPAAVTAVYEHPHGDQLIIQVGGKYYAYEHGKIKYEAKQPKPPWAKMDLQSPGGPASAPSGTGFAAKVTSEVKGKAPVKGQKGAVVTTKDDGAADPYFASQATAAGLNPYAKKLPPGPVVPKVADRKLFDTVHAENQRIAAKDQQKHGLRSTRARFPHTTNQTGIYLPHKRKPPAPRAK